MDMSGMDMSSMDTSNMTMEGLYTPAKPYQLPLTMRQIASQMIMTFFSSTHTALWSNAWAPQSAGAYAGTCIFLIVLAIIFRSLFAVKSILEARWLHQAYNRRYIVVADKQPISERMQQSDVDSLKQGVLTVNGVDENIRVLQKPASGPQPWRLSVDLPRAALVTIIAGVGYLLMLAVMTLNVGYFISVLAGTFMGELAVGRYMNGGEGH
jgi:solute carrier family 31 (copper transporter), member 1